MEDDVAGNICQALPGASTTLAFLGQGLADIYTSTSSNAL